MGKSIINMIEILKKFKRKSSDHIVYVLATILNAAVHFIYTIFVRAQISPLDYGIYSTCLLLQTYMAYIQLGSLNAFNRDYPQYLGAQDKEAEKKCRDSTFSFLVAVFLPCSLFLSLMIGGYGAIRGTNIKYILGLILCTVTTTITIFENFACSRIRIDYGFKYISLVMILELISVPIGFLVVYKMGYYGLYITNICAMVIGIILYYKKGFSDLQLKIDRPMLKMMLVTGIPLLVNNLIWTIVNSIDKFVILGFINTEALGIYSIAQMAFTYMVLIPNAMSQLFYVNLGKVYGETKNRKTLNEVAQKYTLITAVIVGIVVLIAFYFINPVVKWIMPNYLDGVSAAQILLLGLAIYAPTTVNGNILTILRKNGPLVRGSVYLCILNIVCSVGLVLIRGPYIENVALGTALSYLIRTIILIYQLKKYANSSIYGMLKSSVFPVLFIAGPGLILYKVIDNYFIGFGLSFIIAVFILIMFYYKNIINVVSNNK